MATSFANVGQYITVTGNRISKAGSGWNDGNAYLAGTATAGDKKYFEVQIKDGTNYIMFGATDASASYQSNHASTQTTSMACYFHSNSKIWMYDSGQTNVLADPVTITSSDVFGIAFDYDTNTWEVFKNNVSVGSSVEASSFSGDVSFFVSISTGGAWIDVFAKEADWTYTAPTGYTALDNTTGNSTLDANPLLYWKLNEVSGTITDYSGNGHTGTAGGGIAQYVADGVQGSRCIQATSSSHTAYAADNTDFDFDQNFSVSIWFKPTQYNDGNGRWICVHGPSAYNWGLYIAAGGSEISFYVRTSTALVAYVPFNSGTIPLNEWCHLVGTYDGATIRLYLNGSLVTGTGETAQTGSLSANSDNLFIGTNSQGGWVSALGYYDEFSVFNYTLSDTQIAAIYNQVAAGGNECSIDISQNSFVSTNSTMTSQGNPKGMFFGDNGLKLYTTGLSPDEVQQFNLSTAYDISGLSATPDNTVAIGVTGTWFACISSDGLKMYVVSNTNSYVYEYTLSTAWDISTATAGNNKLLAAGLGIAISPNGSKLYLGMGVSGIYQYNLSTPFDITTATYYGASSVTTEEPGSLFLHPDGDYMFSTGIGDNGTYQHYLSIPFDITTAVYQAFWPNNSQTLTEQACALNNNLTQLFVYDAVDDIHIYDTNASNCAVTYSSYSDKINSLSPIAYWRLGEASGTTATDETANSYDGIYYDSPILAKGGLQTTDANTAVSFASGDYMEAAHPFGDVKAISFIVKPTTLTGGEDVIVTLNNGTNEIRAYIDGADNNYLKLTDGTNILNTNVALSSNMVYNIVINYDTSLDVYVNGTLASSSTDFDLSATNSTPTITNFNANEASAKAIRFSPDGNKMFIQGNDSDQIKGYDLSTPFDASTGTLDGNVLGVWSGAQTFCFNDDGTKLYSPSNSSIAEYSLSTPYDLSTASFSQWGFSYLLNPNGFCISGDGMKFIEARDQLGYIYEYNLGTAWDISTGVAGTNFAHGANITNNIQALEYSADGSKLFVGTTHEVHQYDLSAAWDVNSATYVGSFSFGALTTATGFTLRIDNLSDLTALSGSGIVYQWSNTTGTTPSVPSSNTRFGIHTHFNA